jgi:hypothetical protein
MITIGKEYFNNGLLGGSLQNNEPVMGAADCPSREFLTLQIKCLSRGWWLAPDAERGFNPG